MPEDTQELDLPARLEAEIGECFAADLVAHLERQVVIVVAASLSLLEVALAVARDDSDSVQVWLGKSLLTRPAKVDAESWKENPKTRFLSVIVRPYVLVQPLPLEQ